AFEARPAAARGSKRGIGHAELLAPVTGLRSSHPRGVVPAHRLLRHGVNCSLSSNNVLNPFTPFGDCSLIWMANLYANICQVGRKADMRECFNMVPRRPAEMIRLANYGLAVGKAADLVVLDAVEPEIAIAEIVPVLYAFKRAA